MTGFKQAREWLKEFSIAEILQATALCCRLNQLGGRGSPRFDADSFERRAASVEQTNRNRRASLVDCGWGGHHINIVVAHLLEFKCQELWFRTRTLASRHSERSEKWSDWDERHGRIRREVAASESGDERVQSPNRSGDYAEYLV